MSFFPYKNSWIHWNQFMASEGLKKTKECILERATGTKLNFGNSPSGVKLCHCKLQIWSSYWQIVQTKRSCGNFWSLSSLAIKKYQAKIIMNHPNTRFSLVTRA
eukprot:sb/3478048/